MFDDLVYQQGSRFTTWNRLQPTPFYVLLTVTCRENILVQNYMWWKPIKPNNIWITRFLWFLLSLLHHSIRVQSELLKDNLENKRPSAIFLFLSTNEGRVSCWQRKERRWTSFQKMPGMGTWKADVGNEGRRKSSLFWFVTIKTNIFSKTDVKSSDRAQLNSKRTESREETRKGTRVILDYQLWGMVVRSVTVFHTSLAATRATSIFLFDSLPFNMFRRGWKFEIMKAL